jgi:hypothetical protein
MIEVTIRDESKLLYIVIIRPATDKSGQPILDVDAFIPAKGTTLSATMPGGGEISQRVARALMTVFPVASLTLDERHSAAARQARIKLADR